MTRLLTTTLLLAGCNGKLVTIPISSSSETTVPRGTVLEEFLGGLGFDGFTNLDLTTSTELENQGVEPGDITDVYVDELTLTVIDPSGGDMAFIESLAFSVRAPDQPEVRIAHLDDFPAGQTTVEMELDDVDLVEYVVSRSMSFVTDANGTRPNADTTIRADFTLKVGATRQGIFRQVGNNNN